MADAQDDDAANDGGVVSIEGAAFGRYFEKLRKTRGLSREELSGLSGLSIATIRRIEKGHPPGLDTLRKAALGADMPLSALFMNFEDQDTGAIREISFLLRGRDPKLVAIIAQVVRTMVEGASELTPGAKER